MRYSLLLRRWARTDPTIAAVVADAVNRGGIVDHRGVVNIVNIGDVHVAHRAVVEKLSALPSPALIAVTKISVAVTDAAVETYLLTPVAVVYPGVQR